MFKRFIVLSAILCIGITAHAKSYKNTTISLLTVSPGTELYSLFGHSALRIQAPLEGKDLVYNYGTFDFDTPNFTMLFVSGRLDYMLAVNSYYQIYQSSFWEERALYEQVLNLNDEQKERIIQFLEKNALPENKLYRYDFLKDNCSTRIRDVIEYGLKDSAIFNQAKTSYPPLSYRQLLAPFLTNYPWVHFGIDLALGLPADKLTNNSEKMFLPDYMMAIFAQSKLANGESLVDDTRSILTQQREPIQTLNILTPFSVFFAILTLSLIGFSSRRYSRIFCASFFFIIGILGIVVALLAFATDHAAMRNNLNLLWAVPLNIIFFRAAGKKHISKISRYYFITIGILAIFLLTTWNVLPQHFNTAIIPILLTIISASTQISIQRYKPKELAPSSSRIAKNTKSVK